MALTSCPECGKQVSTRAVSCPHCGCPFSKDVSEQAVEIAVARPAIASDLDVGKGIVNWAGNCSALGYCAAAENVGVGVPDGKAGMILHTKGILLTGKMYVPIRKIHVSQILSIHYATRTQLFEKDKSVLKRAVVGGLVLGPLGAIVGGMSGIGTKSTKYKGYVVLNFWDVEQDCPLTIMLATSEEIKARAFCERVHKDFDLA